MALYGFGNKSRAGRSGSATKNARQMGAPGGATPQGAPMIPGRSQGRVTLGGGNPMGARMPTLDQYRRFPPPLAQAPAPVAQQPQQWQGGPPQGSKQNPVVWQKPYQAAGSRATGQQFAASWDTRDRGHTVQQQAAPTDQGAAFAAGGQDHPVVAPQQYGLGQAPSSPYGQAGFAVAQKQGGAPPPAPPQQGGNASRQSAYGQASFGAQYSPDAYAQQKANEQGLTIKGEHATDAEGNVYTWNGTTWYDEDGFQPGTNPYKAPPEPEPAPEETETPKEESMSYYGTTPSGVKTYLDQDGMKWGSIGGEMYKQGSPEYEAALEQEQKTDAYTQEIEDALAAADEPANVDDVVSPKDQKGLFDQIDDQAQQDYENAKLSQAYSNAATGLSTAAGGSGGAGSAMLSAQLNLQKTATKADLQFKWQMAALQKQLDVLKNKLTAYGHLLDIETQQKLQDKINDKNDDILKLQAQNDAIEALFTLAAGGVNSGVLDEDDAMKLAIDALSAGDMDEAAAIAKKYGLEL